MKGFIAFLMCAMFLMLSALVEPAGTSQQKFKCGMNQGMPAMDISVNIPTVATLQSLPIEYGLMYRQDANVLVNPIEALKGQANEIYTNNYNVPLNTNQSIRAHIDPGSQSYTIESNTASVLTSLPYDHGLNRLA